MVRTVWMVWLGEWKGALDACLGDCLPFLFEDGVVDAVVDVSRAVVDIVG